MSNIRCLENDQSIKHCHADMMRNNCDQNDLWLKCSSKLLLCACARVCIIMGVRCSYLAMLFTTLKFSREVIKQLEHGIRIKSRHKSK